MSCLLPPVCVFCQNFMENDPERECKAFHEIPADIMDGNCDHTEPYPGDGGHLFQLEPTEIQTFLELNDIRREFGLPIFRLPKGSKIPNSQNHETRHQNPADYCPDAALALDTSNRQKNTY